VGAGASLVVTRSRIAGNRASGPGGGILVEKGGAASLVSSLVASNAADEEGGGIAVLEEEPGAVRVLSCTIAGNSASAAGGGIFEAAAGAAEITGCLFWENRSGDRPDDLSPGSWSAVRSSILGTEALAGISRNVFSGDLPVPFDPNTYDPIAGSPAVDARQPALDGTAGCVDPASCTRQASVVDPGRFADLHGLPRSLDGDGDGRSLRDLGALELGPRPRVSLEAEASGEQGVHEVSFQAFVEGPWDSVKWDFGDGAPPVYGSLSVVHRYAAAGTYAASVIVGLLDDSTGARIEMVVGSEYIRGDCDGDGAVNITDAIGLLNFLFRMGSVGCLAACDADGGGSLNITDPIRILLSLFMDWGPLLPPRSCGDVSAPTTFTCLESICRN